MNDDYKLLESAWDVRKRMDAAAPAETAQIEGCPDCGAVFSCMRPGDITSWGCDNPFHSRAFAENPTCTDAEHIRRGDHRTSPAETPKYYSICPQCDKPYADCPPGRRRGR